MNIIPLVIVRCLHIVNNNNKLYFCIIFKNRSYKNIKMDKILDKTLKEDSIHQCNLKKSSELSGIFC